MIPRAPRRLAAAIALRMPFDNVVRDRIAVRAPVPRDTRHDARHDTRVTCLTCGGTLETTLDRVFDTRFGIDAAFDIARCVACGLE
jgi:hypothetical protein